MRFRNPANGYEEEADTAWLWCLLFGGFYFAAKGIWTHAVVSLGLAFMTAGISWLIYPFFANDIVQRHFLRSGWIQVGPSGQPTPSPHRQVPQGLSKPALICIAIFAAAVALQYVWSFTSILHSP